MERFTKEDDVVLGGVLTCVFKKVNGLRRVATLDRRTPWWSPKYLREDCTSKHEGTVEREGWDSKTTLSLSLSLSYGDLKSENKREDSERRWKRVVTLAEEERLISPKDR